MNARDNGIPGLARVLPGLTRRFPVLAGRAGQNPDGPATQLARLRSRFPGWRITRTASGSFRARNRSTGARLHGRTPAELEGRLLERLAARAVRASRRGTGRE